jgi:dsRNA-specific ribonuclease
MIEIFTIGVYLRHELVAEGKGRSKQEAEQQAAERAIVAKGWECRLTDSS